ncbi:MAG: glycosyltransferase [Acidimicrobiales bacterium]
MLAEATLLYDPYLASLGGGERYAFALASAASADGPVTVAGPSTPSPEDLVRLGFPALPICTLAPWRYTRASRRYDRVLRLANHLPPAAPLPGRSWLIVQFPFSAFTFRHPARTVQRSRQLDGYRCVVYSDFVLRHLQRRWGVDATVLAPPVEPGHYHEGTKEPLILAVGRFFPGEHTKRHDTLIEAHRSLPPDVAARWPLVLLGCADDSPSTADYIRDLRTQATGANVSFALNASAATLSSLYRRASLFWHATGYGRHPESPERAEHFGISTVEAMSWGAVPLAYRDGGTIETVDPRCGVLWQTPEELAAATAALVADAYRRRAMASAGAIAAWAWRPERFAAQARELLSS